MHKKTNVKIISNVMYLKLILRKSSTQFCITSIGLRIRRSNSNIIARRLSLDYRASNWLLLETRMKIKKEKQGTDVNREFVALSTRIGTKDGDGVHLNLDIPVYVAGMQFHEIR